MPKPFFMHRPSGLFCRFLVPTSLRPIIGCRYIVRALFTSDKDRGRLLASILALSIEQIFKNIRQGQSVDIKKRLDSSQFESLRQLKIARATNADGATFENIEIDSDEDQKRFDKLMRPGNFQPILAEPARRSDKGGLLADRIDSYLIQRKKGELSEKNIAEATFALRGLLLPLCGNKPLNDIDSEDADKLMNALLEWPSNAKKKSSYNDLTLNETIAKARLKKVATIAPRTVEKYLDRIRAFFNWCARNRYLTGPNEFANRHLMTKDKRESQQKKPFDNDDLRRIFDPELRKTCDAPHKFWVPLIALFSGARLNEISQLYVDDIFQSGDVWLFKIEANTKDKKVKNKASERSVPIHSKLIEIGFLKYLSDVKAHGFARLFPNLPTSSKNGYGDSVGDWFNGRYLRPAAHGSKSQRAGVIDPKKSFHSFRYVVINRLYGITSKKTLTAEITGHERGSDVLTNIYITPAEAAERQLTLNSVDYPNLTFAPYISGQLDGFFRRLKRNLP